MQLNLILSLTHSSPGFSLAHCIRMIRCSHLKHLNIFPLSCGISKRILRLRLAVEYRTTWLMRSLCGWNSVHAVMPFGLSDDQTICRVYTSTSSTRPLTRRKFYILFLLGGLKSSSHRLRTRELAGQSPFSVRATRLGHLRSQIQLARVIPGQFQSSSACERGCRDESHCGIPRSNSCSQYFLRYSQSLP